MTDEPLPEEQIDSANADGVHLFRDKPLFPFSFERQAAAQRLSDDSGAENDALLVFLCLSDEATIEAARGSGVAKFRRAMGQWADREKITIHRDNPGRKEVSRIANAIYAELAATDYTPDIKTGGDKPSPNGIG